MISKRRSSKHAFVNVEVAARWLLILAVVLGEGMTIVSSFATKTPLRVQTQWAICRASYQTHGVTCRKRWSLESSNDPNNEVVKGDNNNNNAGNETTLPELTSATDDDKRSWVDHFFSHPLFQQQGRVAPNPPPLQVEDTDLLFFDVFLLLTSTLAISYLVVFRMSVDHLSAAAGEGSLLCLLWIASGLYHGSFLYSAVDGHFSPNDKRSGPAAACMLALHTYITTLNLRLLVALAVAFLEHRAVGTSPTEQLLPLEAGFGLLLMSVWRFLHSAYTPRV